MKKLASVLLVVVLLLLVVAPVSAGPADDPGRPVWYKYTDAVPNDSRTFEGTMTWTSGTRSGYMEFELYYTPYCTGCESHLLEVGTKLTLDNKLFLYVASFEIDPQTMEWGDVRWVSAIDYPSSRWYHTIWVKVIQNSDGRHYQVQMYDCTSSEMLATVNFETDQYDTKSGGLMTVSSSLEYDDPVFNAYGTQSFQKFGGLYWGDNDWYDSGYRPGHEPHDRMHSNRVCSSSLVCTGPAVRSFWQRLFGDKVKYATDGVVVPPPTNKLRPDYYPSDVRIHSVGVQPFESILEEDEYHTWLPYTGYCVDMKQWLHYLWWSN